MDGLNTEQRKAVEAGEGPLLIVAGPGTGKTKTLTARIAFLISAGKAKPEQILALTFTKKAAGEMAQRVKALLGNARQTPHIATFHALCYELLDEELTFISEAQRLQIIKSLAKPVSLKGVSARELGLLISRAKNAISSEDHDISKVLRTYNKALKQQSFSDFDDLLSRAYDLLRTNQQAREAAQARFRYILVDEFQDTNRLQYEFLKLLRSNDNLFVIGDPNQSIYGFRGASGTIFGQFQDDFPTATAITLSVNYRSAPEIVRLSNTIFTEAAPLQAQGSYTGQVRAVQVLNEYSEAAWVLGEIKRSIGGADFLRAVSNDQRDQQRTLRDFAVLYRSRSAAITLQKLFGESGLPYQIVGDGSPYDKPEVQAIVALFRAIAHGEEPELEGFSAAHRNAVLELLRPATGFVPSVLAEKIIATLGFDPGPELAQFVGVLVRFKTIQQVLDYVATIADQGFYDANAEAITLLTIHAAKGLEFPFVFIIGAEEGVLPSRRGEPDEERRLFYVAVTRAKERLDIMHTKHRAGQPTEVSAFVRTLPPETLERMVDPDMHTQVKRLAKRAAKRSQQSLF